MSGLLYPDHPYALWVFIVLTLVLGGAAAWATGRAVAKTWKPYRQSVIYSFVLAAGVQFLHYALFGESLLDVHYYLVNWVVMLIAASIGYRQMRAQQMVTQYSFAFKRTGAFHWHASSGS